MSKDIKIKTYPIDSEEYENLKKYHKIYLKSKKQKKIIFAKFVELLITLLIGALFVGSVCYFFIKVHAFSKIEKHIPKQEITQSDGITFEL